MGDLLTGPRLRVCFLTSELFGWGRYGGRGRAARLLGRELARRGVRVTAITPRQHGQREVEQMDGITVLGYRPDRPWHAAALCRDCDADVYHSHDPSLATALAAFALPARAHVVTVRALHTARTRLATLRAPPYGRLRAVARWAEEANPLVWLAVHRAHATFCAAHDLIPLVRAKYRLAEASFLPTAVEVPRRVQKGRTPMVCFLGGWERPCRPEAFIALAARFPRVTFVGVGRSMDRAYDAHLRRALAPLANVRLLGFVNPFRSEALSQVLSESWILLSASAHLGLPDAWLEGGAHRCAILSATDCDGFAARFGVHAADGDLAAGLDALLAGDAWRERGLRGYEHVRDTFELSRAVAQHVDAYQRAMQLPDSVSPAKFPS